MTFHSDGKEGEKELRGSKNLELVQKTGKKISRAHKNARLGLSVGVNQNFSKLFLFSIKRASLADVEHGNSR